MISFGHKKILIQYVPPPLSPVLETKLSWKMINYQNLQQELNWQILDNNLTFSSVNSERYWTICAFSILGVTDKFCEICWLILFREHSAVFINLMKKKFSQQLLTSWSDTVCDVGDKGSLVNSVNFNIVLTISPANWATQNKSIWLTLDKLQ